MITEKLRSQTQVFLRLEGQAADQSSGFAQVTQGCFDDQTRRTHGCGIEEPFNITRGQAFEGSIEDGHGFADARGGLYEEDAFIAQAGQTLPHHIFLSAAQLFIRKAQ